VNGPPYGHGCLGALLFSLFWTVTQAAFRLLVSIFVIFLELISGVREWPTYPTSLLKLLGGLSGFFGFLGIFSLGMQLMALGLGGSAGPPVDGSVLWKQGILIMLLFATTRFCFRRML